MLHKMLCNKDYKIVKPYAFWARNRKNAAYCCRSDRVGLGEFGFYDCKMVRSEAMCASTSTPLGFSFVCSQV